MNGGFFLNESIKIIRMYYLKKIQPGVLLDEKMFNLADVDCDGDVDLVDAHCIIEDYKEMGASMPRFEDGKFYTVITESEIQEIINEDIGIMFGFYKADTLEELYDAQKKWHDLIDVNSDEEVSVNDAASVLGIYASNAAGVELDETQTNALGLADIDANGTVDISDATLVLTAYAKAGAGLL